MRDKNRTKKASASRLAQPRHRDGKTPVEAGERLAAVLDSLDAIVYGADIETHEIIYINKHARDLFGDVEGKPCWQVFQEGQTGPCGFCTNEKILDAGGNPAGAYVWEFRNTVSGRWYAIRERAIRWVDDRIVRVAIATDITERRRLEDALSLSLNEKEMLLKEVHHRVKNNLAVISSLLSLQSRELKDEKTRDLLSETKNRVKAMSMIHEKLYLSGDFRRLNLGEYIRDLATRLFRSYALRAGIRLKMDIPDVSLDVDTVIPCGLIVNELVSNALKYAFPEGREGAVSIDVRPAEEGRYTLVVSDDGVGLPEGADLSGISSVGLQIVISLAEQLGGAVECESSGGVEFRITFNDKGFGSGHITRLQAPGEI